METVKTKTLRFTTSWIIDHGDPEGVGTSIKDVIDLTSDLYSIVDLAKEILSEEGASLIDWIFMILSLLL